MGGELSHAGMDESVEVVLEQYRVWLVQERGLAPESVRCYLTQARPFLVALPFPLDEALQGLSAGQVTAFMLGRCAGRNVWSAKAAVTAVRSLLWFLHLVGHVPVGLAGAVPSVAGWRLASLPRGLDAGQVALLLAACDRGSPVGRRDFAVLTVLARLGLRGAEIAGLRLVDVDWRAGELTVRGKANRIDGLPLPVAVGEALVAYLTDGRPACDEATLFDRPRPVPTAVAGSGTPDCGPRLPAGGASIAVAPFEAISLMVTDRSSYTEHSSVMLRLPELSARRLRSGPAFGNDSTRSVALCLLSDLSCRAWDRQVRSCLEGSLNISTRM